MNMPMIAPAQAATVSGKSSGYLQAEMVQMTITRNRRVIIATQALAGGTTAAYREEGSGHLQSLNG